MSAIEGVAGVTGAVTPRPAAAPVAPPQAQAVQPAQPAQPARSDTFAANSGGGLVESHFSVDPDTHETVVSVVDATTQEVIRELPPEAIRNLSKTLAHFIGQKMDNKA